MKRLNRLALVLLLATAPVVSDSALADRKGKGHGTNTASAGDSNAGASAGSGSGSISVIDNSSSSGGTDSVAEVVITSGDTVLHTIHEYEAVAQSISSLNLGYCSSGGGVADKHASFNVGGTEFLCQINILIPMITGKAKNLHTQGDSEGAMAELAKIDELVEMGVKYLNRRAWTAWMEGLFRDVWWIFALALIGL